MGFHVALVQHSAGTMTRWYVSIRTTSTPPEDSQDIIEEQKKPLTPPEDSQDIIEEQKKPLTLPEDSQDIIEEQKKPLGNS